MVLLAGERQNLRAHRSGGLLVGASQMPFAFEI